MVLSDLNLELGKASFSGMWCFYCAESSFSNDDPGRLEDHFEKWSKDFVPEISKNNKISQFSYRCHIMGESNPSPSIKFQISEFPCLTHVFEIQMSGKLK